MKQIKTFKYLMMAMMAAVCMTFAACGGDSDDDDVPGGGNAQIGVHRVDLHFDVTLPSWHSTVGFHGIKPDGSFSRLYENGNELPLYEISGQGTGYISEEIRDYSICTDNNCGAIVAHVMLISFDGKPAPHDVTVTAVGYINDKRIYTKVFTLPTGASSMVMAFTTDDGGESELVIDNEIVESHFNHD
jgi:hypothetical protein